MMTHQETESLKNQVNQQRTSHRVLNQVVGNIKALIPYKTSPFLWTHEFTHDQNLGIHVPSPHMCP
ncbi:hypothetical protein KY285_010559 [Solanum tuberosum]|nr:hypothetical protein KY289_011105 [Solanum tuberosum]KAH0734852.1 hypothetical protein KY285_010559 [Solanum tuberosum]